MVVQFHQDNITIRRPQPRNRREPLATTATSTSTGTGTDIGTMPKPRTPRGGKQKVKPVDLVTGKATVEYFFDPSLVIRKAGSGSSGGVGDRSKHGYGASNSGTSSVQDDRFFASKHLFMPCTIIKPLDEGENSNTIHATSAGAGGGQNQNQNSNNNSSNGQQMQQPYPGPTLVKTSHDGALHKISDSTKLVPLHAPADYVGADDVILQLPQVSEQSLLHALRTRYNRDDIYTSAGPILISINPYKQVFIGGGSASGTAESIYSDEQMMLYRRKTSSSSPRGADSASSPSFSTSSSSSSKPPHLFQIADRAYTALMDSIHSTASSASTPFFEEEDEPQHHHHDPRVRNQSILVSGESGAGKTEATKIIMKYLARITTSASHARHSSNTAIMDDLLSPNGKRSAALEDRVLSSNPLLETFGNAQTLRNDNSSRFGKFIHIYFNLNTTATASSSGGAITGASISNYLLEKTRITKQVEGERNYHVFYQLLAGASDDMLQEFGLEDRNAALFHYLGGLQQQESENNKNDIDNTAIEHFEDKEAFEETVQCLKSIGLSSETQRDVFSIVAAVLHLGNIQFEEEGEDISGSGENNGSDNNNNDSSGNSGRGGGIESEHAKIRESSRPSLQKACELLGFPDQERLSEALLTKTLVVNGKTIKKRQNVVMAEDKRDALAKLTYSSLFLWLIQCVNDTLSQASNNSSINSATTTTLSSSRSPKAVSVASKPKDQIGYIGVLDIYGFECFETNGYEQLLINYCNEKLQRHFNRHLFEVEQQIYLNEGVDWSYITFNDNRPCLELIEGGGGGSGSYCVGILNTLDDAWGGMGTASEKDVKFVTHLHKLFGPAESLSSSTSSFNKNESEVETSHENFVTPKFGKDRQFIIIHYAGEVRYTADGFVEKNMDSISNELRELGDAATRDLPKEVYSCTAATSSSTRSTIRGVSVGSQFRTSLQLLVADLERTQPHYVRCIKPNLTKSPGTFLSGEVLKQLRYSGMMEAIRIRREGYAFREDHESFYHRFSVLLTSDELMQGQDTGIVQLVKVLSRRLHVTDADWQIGHSKIFLRRELADKLERLARLRVNVAARTLGRFGRFAANKRLSSLLVQWGRFRLHMLKVYRVNRAATKLAAATRRYKQLQAYMATRRGFIRLQAEQRRKMAVLRTKRLRDPFYDVSFHECQELLQKEQSRLEEAARKKNFRLAANLEARIAAIVDAIERKRPLTRSVLEGRIEAVQKLLDDAVLRKAYAECGPLQDQLDELLSKRADLPTIDELKQAVRSLEDEVALVAKNRDFVAAAAGQGRLEEARSRLADVLAADGAEEDDVAADTGNKFGFESRAQLELEIADLLVQIKKAVESRNFGKASSLQHLLEEREKLRPMFPSLEELRAELSAAKRKLDEAISKKDFAGASYLNDEILGLESRLESESANQPIPPAGDASKVSMLTSSGEMKIFESRGDLEKAIAEATALVSKSVAARDFKQADSVQSEVDKMVKLRESLPSLAQLKQQLDERTKEMNAAIAEKKFAKAEELNAIVEKLTMRVEIEKKATKALSPVENVILHVERKTPDISSVKTTPAPLAANTSVASISAKSAPVRSGPPMEVSSDATKTVRKLRPSPPLISASDESIVSVTKMLAKKRASASIVVDPNTGELVGIVTDTDFTNRVVAKNVDPDSTPVSAIMTPRPTCVSLADNAIEALTTMVENHFRHLPVIDTDGSVAGLLDISKCLTDAIAKLETVHDEQHSSASVVTAEEVVKQVSQQISDQAQAAALQSVLAMLMRGAAGGAKAVPTLRSLLHEKPSTVVRPNQSIRQASLLMAEHRHAALVVDEAGTLVGIFGVKDMMSRAIAKQLDLDRTPVSEVMTLDPETVIADVNVIEALYTMSDHRILSLPVCEKNGAVVGVLDIMDILYGCGGTEGWRSVFASAMDADDDVSDVSSVFSATSAPKRTIAGQTKPLPLSGVKESVEERPVSKLRPSKPVVTTTDDSLLRTAKLLASKRSSASLIIDPSTGSLAGILTDKDVTCRVVAKYLQPSSTSVSDVMTPNPTCVSTNDAAMDALTLMVENRFRHLPVVDDQGAITGTLDIVKCLTAIIGKLEKVEKKGSKVAKDVVEQVVNQQGASGAQAAALQQLLGNLLSQATGGKAIPTLRNILHKKSSTIVLPSTSIRDAGLVMAEHRHAALIVNEDGHLVGIFSFKDMMSRAVAKELDLDSTPVSEVMTPDPETVVPDISVLEALQTMSDHKFLTLPVCEANGNVIGVVDALDVICSCGGAEGWRSVFSSALEAGDDATSTAASAHSKSVNSVESKGKRKKIYERTVKKLRPPKPNLALSNESIVSVAQLLQRKRGDSTLVITPEGALAGIVTDTDFTRRVVAKDIDPETTPVSEIITPDPTCVAMSDPAMEALTLMVENHFRHLPVVDDDGSVVGLLDIGKCLNDAIERLERQGEKAANSTLDAVKKVANIQDADSAHAAALHALLGSLMSTAVGGKALPTLRSLLHQKPNTIVGPTTSIREAGRLMSESRHAALVVDEGRLVGIFGFKDMVNRCIAKRLDLDVAPICEVMTPDPESVTPDITVLEALQIMYDQKFLTLPVCEANGKVVGVVTVMDVIYGCGGTEGWRSIFSSAMDTYDDEDSKSIGVSVTNAPFPSGIPANLEFKPAVMEDSIVSQRLFGDDDGTQTDSDKAVFKVSDPSGYTHRIKCEARIAVLKDAVVDKAHIPLRVLQLQYVDEEGDTVTMTSDEDVVHAWELAKKSNSRVAKINAIACESKAAKVRATDQQMIMVAAGVAGAAAIGLAFLLLRPKKN